MSDQILHIETLVVEGHDEAYQYAPPMHIVNP